MKWLRYRIKTTAEAEDIIISTLYDIGLEGAQIEDKIPLSAYEKEQMFVDIAPEGADDDGTAYLSFFVEEAVPTSDCPKTSCAQSSTPAFAENPSLSVADSPKGKLNGEIVSAEKILKDIEDALAELKDFNIDIGDGTVTCDETEDIDWINNWKQYFHKFNVDDVLVIPSWEDTDSADSFKYILHIDPGTAFGTGAHETTQLCIRALHKYVKDGDELLDVGTGSGILAILALMFGAKAALGTDLDTCAIDAVRDNKERNGIPDNSFNLLIGNIITDDEIKNKVGYNKYDIVTANILAEVLVPLTPVVKECLKPGGIYITSGIIEGKEGIVREAMEKAGLSIIEECSQGEWRALAAKRTD